TALDLNDEVRSGADVVLVVGSRLGETDWWGKAPNWGRPGEQRTIQVDVDEERIGVNKPIEIGLVADAREALRAIADAVAGLDVPRRPERVTRLRGWQKTKAEVRAKLDTPLEKAATSSPVHPGLVPGAAQQVMPDD